MGGRGGSGGGKGGGGGGGLGVYARDQIRLAHQLVREGGDRTDAANQLMTAARFLAGHLENRGVISDARAFGDASGAMSATQRAAARTADARALRAAARALTTVNGRA